MTKRKSTKQALLLSALSLLLCVSMLIGSTFAWFTDSVTSANNKIQAGTLDIQLLMYDGADYADISNSDKPIFGAGSIAQNINGETLWEPGKTQVAYLAIKNNGSLALKYKAALEVENVSKDLYEVMEYAIIADAQPDSVKSWVDGNAVVVGKQAVSGDVSLAAGATHYFALVIHMNEEAGNKYQGGEVNFDLTVLATQDAVERDSFNDQYDLNAEYPLGKPSSVRAENSMFKAVIHIPSDAPEGEYELELPEEKIEISNVNGNATTKLEMELLRNDNPVTASGVEYPVAIQMPHPFVKITEVLHNGKSVNNLTFDQTTGTISFTTPHFSPFEIKYVDYVDPSFPLEYTEDDGQFRITKGMFVGKNPVEFDASLAETDSEYIAVDYVKDGRKYYVVSERATSIIVGDADDGDLDYTFENANIPAVKKINNNTLCTSAVLTLNDYDHGTLYILPGIYKEQRRLDIYGSMDIIGLSNPEEISLIKQGTTSTASSHRHLINVSGGSGKALTDHIQVTIRNLHLDATVSNGSGSFWQLKDNGAVQSIRRSKVKCYDLIIDDNSTAAFYVNGNNAVDGVKYPAYMYVENCVVNVNNAGAIVDNRGAGDAYFRYHNLFYANGATEYTSTGSLIKREAMTADDWWN